jgi:hypothetical protein
VYTVIETPVYAGKVKQILNDDAIHYNRLNDGEIWLLTLYAKSELSTIPAHELRMIKEVVDSD